MFSNIDDANSPPEDSNSLRVNDTANDAYQSVAVNMPAAYVAIELEDSEWSDGMFTIGDGTATENPPLRAGFAYRAFIKAYPQRARVCISQYKLFLCCY